MEVFNEINKLKIFYNSNHISQKTIGFVPTMGALHEGHISLVRKSKEENDITVCSIFVNPIQFNNKEDLKKYPRDLDSDLKMLEKEKCDIVFAPSVEEMYPEPDNTKYDFGHLDKILEGEFREGHFNGVAVVVKKLFDIVNPSKAYFGNKDYQQLTIVRQLVKMLKLDIEIVGCPIIREKDGLAMSSRNKLLTVEERNAASNIPKILFRAKELKHSIPIKILKHWIEDEINSVPLLKLEYFDIVNSETLLSISSFNKDEKNIACIAVYSGKIRLIDNIVF